MDLSGKNVVFVAGLGGIGFESCKQLMKRNLSYLFILDLLDKPEAVAALQALNPKTKVQFIKLDVTCNESIKKAIGAVVAQVQYIDVLVNGAGIMCEQSVELTLNVNLAGLINTTYVALPYMDKAQKGRGGVILNIASILGIGPSPPLITYAASKYGVVGFTRSLADPFYYKRSGIAVTGICPGLTRTPLVDKSKVASTFDYGRPLLDEFLANEHQPAPVAGEHLVKIIEMAQNDTLWMSKDSKLSKVDFPKYF